MLRGDANRVRELGLELARAFVRDAEQLADPGARPDLIGVPDTMGPDETQAYLEKARENLAQVEYKAKHPDRSSSFFWV